MLPQSCGNGEEVLCVTRRQARAVVPPTCRAVAVYPTVNREASMNEQLLESALLSCRVMCERLAPDAAKLVLAGGRRLRQAKLVEFRYDREKLGVERV